MRKKIVAMSKNIVPNIILAMQSKASPMEVAVAIGERLQLLGVSDFKIIPNGTIVIGQNNDDKSYVSALFQNVHSLINNRVGAEFDYSIVIPPFMSESDFDHCDLGNNNICISTKMFIQELDFIKLRLTQHLFHESEHLVGNISVMNEKTHLPIRFSAGMGLKSTLPKLYRDDGYVESDELAAYMNNLHIELSVLNESVLKMVSMEEAIDVKNAIQVFRKDNKNSLSFLSADSSVHNQSTARLIMPDIRVYKFVYFVCFRSY